MKKKALLTSMLVIALCLCLIAGSTYALFTSQSVVNIAVTAGKVKASAQMTDLTVWSLGETEENPTRPKGFFENGGFAEIKDGSLLEIDRMTPGDTVKFTIHVLNTSNVTTQYRLSAVSQASDDPKVPDLSKALTITSIVDDKDGDDTNNVTYTMSYIDDQNQNRTFKTPWFKKAATDGENGVEVLTITVIVTFPNGTPEEDDPFQNGKAKLAFTVEAVQGNGVDADGNLITTP